MMATRPTWATRPVLSAIEAVADAMIVSPKQLRQNGCRLSHQVQQRQLVMWLARKRGASWMHMAHYLGFNYTTCMHGVRRAEERRLQNARFRRLSDHLLAKLEGRS